MFRVKISCNLDTIYYFEIRPCSEEPLSIKVTFYTPPLIHSLIEPNLTSVCVALQVSRLYYILLGYNLIFGSSAISGELHSCITV